MPHSNLQETVPVSKTNVDEKAELKILQAQLQAVHVLIQEEEKVLENVKAEVGSYDAKLALLEDLTKKIQLLKEQEAVLQKSIQELSATDDQNKLKLAQFNSDKQKFESEISDLETKLANLNTSKTQEENESVNRDKRFKDSDSEKRLALEKLDQEIDKKKTEFQLFVQSNQEQEKLFSENCNKNIEKNKALDLLSSQIADEQKNFDEIKQSISDLKIEAEKQKVIVQGIKDSKDKELLDREQAIVARENILAEREGANSLKESFLEQKTQDLRTKKREIEKQLGRSLSINI